MRMFRRGESLGVILVATLALLLPTLAASGPYDKKSLDAARDLLESSGEDTKPVYDKDYYSTDQRVRNLLKTVEAYHLNQGIQKMSIRHYEPAFEDFDFILRYYPNHPRALGLMGELCLSMGRKDAADGYFRHAIATFPNNPRAARAITYREYGKFLYRSGETGAALRNLTQSVELDPDTSETQYYLGLAQFAAKDYAKANERAQIAYAKGFPLTELRDKLMAAGAWKPTNVSKTQ